MLSRHASSLYWLGRYQERTEFVARYLEVHYFSNMDSSMSEFRDFSMRSILFMATGIPCSDKEYDEGDLLWNVALNRDSDSSILSNVTAVRNNAKAVRNLISSEMWETINKNYLFADSFSPSHLKTRGLYEFTQRIQENAGVLESKITNTLLHNETWRFIKSGVYIERTFQILRTIQNTISDINALKAGKENPALENFHWSLCLKVLEAADMTRKILKTTTYKDIACEFLISNVDFPKSIAYSLSRIKSHLGYLNPQNAKHLDRNSLSFKVSKLSGNIKYLDYLDIKNDLETFLIAIQKEIAQLNSLMHEEFFEAKL